MANNKNYFKMIFGLSNKHYDQIIKVFSKYQNIERVILYGSRAKGFQKAYSDIDITLIGDPLDLSLLQKIELELDDLLLPFKFDVSNYKTIDNKELLEHIKRVGKIFYLNKS